MKAYSEYKYSGVEWIGDIPVQWDLVKLKHNTDVSFSSIDRHVYDEERKVSICHYPDAYKSEILNASTNLSSGTCTSSEFERYQLKEDQVIITKDSESADDIGIPTYVGMTFENAVCGYHLAILQATNKLLNGKYIFRYLQSNNVKYFFETNSNGVTRFGLGKPTIQNLPITIPPQYELSQIVKYLDHQTGLIDAIIEKKQQLIEKLKEQRQAIINEAVTKGLNPDAPMKDSGIEWLGDIPEHWEGKRLKFLFNIRKDIAGKLGYDVLSITQRGLKVRDLEDTKGQLSMDYSKYQIVKPGDFAMNHMDLLTGYIDLSAQTGVTSPDYRVFELFEKNALDKYYLYLFQMGYKQKIFYSYGQGVSQFGRWRLPAEAFKNIVFPKPPLKEQVEIVNYLNRITSRIDTLIEQTLESVINLKSYRQSIISETVTGKVDVRDWEPKNKEFINQ